MHSQDPEYMRLFQEPSIDSHTEIARMVFGDPSRREESKAIAHSHNYGAGVRSIAAKNGLPLETVEEFDRAMRAQFPRLVTWKDEVRQKAASGALLDNGFGRKMRPEKDRAWTQGPALMGQGLARDLLAEGLLRLPLEAVARLKAVIHDEVVFSVPLADVEEFKQVVLDALQFEYMGVPVTAGYEGYGENWGAIYVK
jgi:DNA polymerase-1